MTSQYWVTSGRLRPHCRCRMAIRCGVAWMPRIVSAGSPGIRWIMKNTTIVTPSATGTSISSRWNTNVMRPKDHHPSGAGTGGARRAAGSCRIPACPMPPGPRSLAQPDVLHVVVAERSDKEVMHLRRGGVGVRGVVKEGHERVAGRVILNVVVQSLPLGRIEGPL